jgi:ATP synthase subunit 6
MFIYNPLEQFQVSPLFTLFIYNNSNFLDFSLSNYSVTVALLCFFFVMIINVFSFFYEVNLLIQTIVLNFINVSLQMIKDHIGTVGKTLFPLLTTYMFITFCANLLGMVPYGITLTAQLVITFYLALTLFVALNICGVSIHKHTFLNLFFPSGSPLALAPLIVPIEIVSYVFRVISLSVRLFANMMAGHTLLKVIGGFGWNMLNDSGLTIIFGLVPVLVITILIGLELAVAAIQAYVFITLASIYFHDAFLMH